MKQNSFKRILTLIFILLISLTLISCDGTFSLGDGTKLDWFKDDDDTTDTTTKTEASTPYEEAVSEGYKGSYTEWLVELFKTEEYKSIYETMVQEGTFTGTLTEFIEMLKGEAGTTDIQEATSIGLRSVVTVFSTATDLSSATETTKASGSAGAGVIFKEELNDNTKTGVCYIITNFHVCYGQETSTRNSFGRIVTSKSLYSHIYINFYGMPLAKQRVEAEYIGGSAEYDIAVLKVTSNLYKNSEVLSPCTLGDSNTILTGDSVIAIGNPEGDGISATSGIVSVPLETIEMERADDSQTAEFKVIRIDAAVNGGNSGGGLFNASGKLIGIVNAKTVDEEVEGICYALPINFSIAVANRILTTCNSTTKTIQKPVLGIWTTVSDSKPVYDSKTKSVSTEYTISVLSVNKAGVNDPNGTAVTTNSICLNKLEVGDKLVYITFKGKQYNIISQFSIEEVLLLAYSGDEIEFHVIRTTDSVETETTVTVTITDGCLKNVD